jgi:hypothetical protein
MKVQEEASALKKLNPSVVKNKVDAQQKS